MIRLIREKIPDLKYIRTSERGINEDDDVLIKSIGVHSSYSTSKVLKIASGDKSYMKWIVLNYKIKEAIKYLCRKFRE